MEQQGLGSLMTMRWYKKALAASAAGGVDTLRRGVGARGGSTPSAAASAGRWFWGMLFESGSPAGKSGFHNMTWLLEVEETSPFL